MSRVQSAQPGVSARVLPLVTARAFVKKHWGDAWEAPAFLQPLRVTDAAAPSTPEATLLHRYGELLLAGDAGWTVREAKDYTDWYVKIEIVSPTAVETVFVGVFADLGSSPDAKSEGNDPSGTAEVGAYGLAHLLDRIEIRDSVVTDGGEITTVARVLPFNASDRFGLDLVGNRSAIQYDGRHLFDAKNGDTWSNLDVIRYLLKLAAEETGIPWSVEGQFEDLAKIVMAHDFSGQSVFDALNRLIDRRRGYVWDVVESNGKAAVHVRPVFGTPVSVGDISLSANAQAVQLLFNDVAYARPQVRIVAATRYDRIVVEGERIKSCFTVSFRDGTLEPDWTDEQAEAYADATDDDRKHDRFRRVYRRFRLPKDWEWKAGNGAGGGKNNVAISAGDDGTLLPDVRSNQFRRGKSFLQQIPILIEDDGSEDGTVGPGEYLPPLVIARTDDDEAKFYQVDNGADDVSAAHVRTVNGDLAFEIQPKINHVYAKNHFDAEAVNETGVEAAVDYESLIATVCVDLDTRLRVVEKLGDQVRRTRTIRVEGAEAWVIAPGTVTGIAEGKLTRHSGKRVLRDDSKRLRVVAAAAKAWYGEPRAAIEVSLQTIFTVCPLCSYVTQAVFGADEKQIGTVVTSREFDFENRTTRIQTGYWELDFASMSGQSGQSFASEADGIGSLRQQVANVPARLARPGGGEGLGAARLAVLSSDSDNQAGPRMFRMIQVFDDGSYSVVGDEEDEIAGYVLDRY